jgi:hypothetical protein
MHGTWQTTGGSGGGGAIAAVVAGMILATALAGPVVHAAVGLLHLVVIILAIVFALALVSVIALMAFRVHRRNQVPAVQVLQLRKTRVQEIPASEVPALPAPSPELHLHFHGVDAEDVAAIIREHQ